MRIEICHKKSPRRCFGQLRKPLILFYFCNKSPYILAFYRKNPIHSEYPMTKTFCIQLQFKSSHKSEQGYHGDSKAHNSDELLEKQICLRGLKRIPAAEPPSSAKG